MLICICRIFPVEVLPNGKRLTLPCGGIFFLPSDTMEGGMLMTIFELISLLSFSITVFQLGYLIGNKEKRDNRPDQG